MGIQTLEVLRALKGAPLSILVAFLVLQEPLGHDYLVRLTGWSKDKVTEGLLVLQDMGFAEPIPGKRYSGWVLTDRVHQLEIFRSTHKISDSTLTTTALTNKEPYILSSSSKAVECEKIGLDIREKYEVIDILHEAGIFGRTAVELANNSWVTKEYAIEHIKKAKREHKPVPLLIHRMREHDPMPEVEADEYVPSSKGKYADCIIT